MIKWIKRNPTKLTGFFLVLAGSLQANTTVLQAVLTPAQFAWFTVAVGCLVAALGFINGSKQPQT